MQKKIASQKAFTLLEIMVAMVIFAVGMLGLAGIQALSLENSHSSYSRSQAILLAYDMVDRMKANPTAITYAIAVDAAAAVPANNKKCDANACNDAEMAAFDKWQWKVSLPGLLLSGQGQIVYDAVDDDYTITVHWDEDRTGATGTTCPPAVATDLRCFQLMTQL